MLCHGRSARLRSSVGHGEVKHRVRKGYIQMRCHLYGAWSISAEMAPSFPTQHTDLASTVLITHGKIGITHGIGTLP